MKAIDRVLGILLLLLTIVLANRGLWLCLIDVTDPESFCSYNYPGEELILYLLGCGLAIGLLMRNRLGRAFTSKWKGNLVVLVFIGMALLSISWSIRPTATLYYLLILLFSTLLAAFFGTFYSFESWLTLLAGTGAIVVVASGILSGLFPQAVIMAAPHEGAWRGIYWHKNLTGSLMAFWNSVFLLYALHFLQSAKWQVVGSAIFYALSLVSVFISRSAAGIAICLGLNAIVLVLWLWTKFRHLLRKRHYIWLGFTTLVIVVTAVANLDFIFRLLNREATFTGRTPLWSYLIETAVRPKPLLGHGFSAIWDDRAFRNQVTLAQGWPFPITNSHNGFMDVLLGVGMIGLALAVMLLIQAFYRTGKHFIFNDGVVNLLPFISVVYFLLANLSTSFFFVMDSFHWILLVSAMFLCTPASDGRVQFTPSVDTV